ncbi:Rubrerythrin [Denitrovibrio acetiphilus DSM 12809]|uniref:Rubrerythrin n=1 Tax=Denitrovibrio acetiphilus (strain DSM 12809 / NBRC 114555 / N2460) TaxID=522772 RepID=D4H4Z1_DENA2|nr:ferritin family protein [Denitrovibrio acetiphilus]ADD69347.1 Rubrerythrin [Denitrovibrio acetiphilus DSM 12809]
MNFALIGALKTAYEAEKEGMRSYLHFAKETNVAGGKDMFIQLALDEVDHMELIQNFMEKTLKGETFTTVEVPAGRLSKIMPDLQDASRQKIDKASVSDEQALKIAMEQEVKARTFYLEEAGKADDAVVKELFEKLAGVEQKHYDILKAELDFMHEDGFWFDAMEFSLEK